MKLLEIEDNVGKFLKGDALVSVNEIEKEDLLEIVRKIVNNDFDFTEPDDAYFEEIKNPINKLIYSEIYTNLYKISNEKNQIISDINLKMEAIVE